MQDDIPPVTQEYLNRHPELEAQGVKVGDPLPDAPQPMIRETLDKESMAKSDEPKIAPPVENALNSEGVMEDIKKSRDGQFMIYTIRRANQPDEIVRVVSGSEDDKRMEQRMNNPLKGNNNLEEQIKENTTEEVVTGEQFAVIDENKREIRVYNTTDHGEKAEELANQFAEKVSGTVKKK